MNFSLFKCCGHNKATMTENFPKAPSRPKSYSRPSGLRKASFLAEVMSPCLLKIEFLVSIKEKGPKSSYIRVVWSFKSYLPSEYGVEIGDGKTSVQLQDLVGLLQGQVAVALSQQRLAASHLLGSTSDLLLRSSGLLGRTTSLSLGLQRSLIEFLKHV